jgi:hypothetical protein
MASTEDPRKRKIICSWWELIAQLRIRRSTSRPRVAPILEKLITLPVIVKVDVLTFSAFYSIKQLKRLLSCSSWCKEVVYIENFIF